MTYKRKNAVAFLWLVLSGGSVGWIATQNAQCSVTATPANCQFVLNASAPGDTISFQAGATFPIFTPQSNRMYVGNGAILAGKGTGSDLLNFTNLSNVDFSGFVLNGVQSCGDNATNLNFHDNTVENMKADGFREGGMTNSQINHNSFQNIGGNGIYGYPGSGNQFNNNTFDYCSENIHLAASTCDNTQVNGNVCTHTSRIGIELQSKMTNLQVENNYIADWLQNGTGSNNSHMGISCATGYGSNITISSNVLIQNGPAQNVGLGNMAAIEIFGGAGVVISNNYGWNWNCAILDGIEPVGLDSKNNVEVGGHLTDNDNVGGAYQIGPVRSAGDKIYALDDPNAPAWPANPALAPATTQPTTAPSSGGVAAPTNVTAVAGTTPGTILATWSAGAGTPTVYLYPTTRGVGSAINVGQLSAGATSATIGNINDTWEVTALVTYTVGGVESSKTASQDVQVMGGPAAGLTFNPSLIQTGATISAQTQTPEIPAASTSSAQAASVQTTQPALAHTISVYSDGTVSVK